MTSTSLMRILARAAVISLTIGLSLAEGHAMVSARSRLPAAVPSSVVSQADAGRVRFRVNFSRWAGPPLVKTKFGVYQTPFLTQDQLLRAAALMGEAGVQDMRYEMGWGKPDAYAGDQISGAIQNPVIDFSRLDPFVGQARRIGIQPLLSMGYCPVSLQSRTGWQAWKDAPSDLDAWQSILQRFAAHYKTSLGLQGPFYEIWNEPDIPGDGPKMFFSGGPQDYKAVYKHGAAGVRAGDPGALAGGPVIAYDLSYVVPILSEPLDFVSIHAYDNYTGQIDGLRRLVRDRPELPILLTEYASFKEFGPTAPVSRYPAAMRFFRDVKGLLNNTDVPKVYWAQWVDDSMGFLTRDFHRKAIFNALRIYQTMLPVDRNAVTPDGDDGVGVLASSDGNNAGVVLSNENAEERTVAVQLTHIPFEHGTMQVYRIDRDHASYGDNPAAEGLASSEDRRFHGSDISWSGIVPAESVVFLRLWDGSRKSLLRPARIGTFVRCHEWFPDRAEVSGAYTDFDPHTAVARVGLGRKDTGVAQVGVVLDHPARRIRVQAKRDGAFVPHGKNALFGLRVDYGSQGGAFATSVLWHDGSYRPNRDARLPWGTRTASVSADVKRSELRGKGAFVMDIAGKAPKHWNGRIILTPILQDMGTGSRARFVLTAG